MVADIGDAHQGIGRHLLFDREVPILHARISLSGIHEIDGIARRNQLGVIQVDDGTGRVEPGDILRHAA